MERILNDKKIIRANPGSFQVCHDDFTDIIADPESGEVLCSKCGMVITEKSEDIAGPEWRAYTAVERNEKARTGAPTSLAKHDRGLATLMSKTGRDASGQKLDTAVYSTYKRLRTWDNRILHDSTEDRNLSQAFHMLFALKDKLGLSSAVIEKVAYLYRKAHERKLVRGRSTSGMLGAALYLACREMGSLRTLNDVVVASNVKRKDIARNCRLLVRELDIKVPIADPIRCVTKIASNANLSEKTIRLAINIMTKVVEKEMNAGKHPMTLAATALYISSVRTGERMSQTRVAHAAGITEVTLRNRIKDVRLAKVLE